MALEPPVREFMARFFGINGRRTTVNSHEPHATLSASKEGYDEAVRLGYVTVEAGDSRGSLVLRCTEEGEKIALDGARELALAIFPSLQGQA